MKKFKSILVAVLLVFIVASPIGAVAAEEDNYDYPICEYNEDGEPTNYPCLYPIAPLNHVDFPD
ncbi:hypothetical protein [Anaerorhabdus sp.]|uniref:hypothetical protein n=1 Tax=Anaerorhabdus sp. TaxID=1872524 RepID=UPI002FCC0474